MQVNRVIILLTGKIYCVSGIWHCPKKGNTLCKSTILFKEAGFSVA
jgi:hypothetical protein